MYSVDTHMHVRTHMLRHTFAAIDIALTLVRLDSRKSSKTALRSRKVSELPKQSAVGTRQV